MEHRIIDLRDPDDYMPWDEYNRLIAKAERSNKRREAARKGWETRRRNKS